MASGDDVIWLPGDVRTEIHVRGEDTEGAFCLMVDQPPAGWRLPVHRHLREAETIHVVEGRFAMEIGGKRTVLEPGDTVHVPAGVVHSGGNIAAETGRRVVIFSPAGLERFFLEIGADRPDQPIDLPSMIAAAARHGFIFSEEAASNSRN